MDYRRLTTAEAVMSGVMNKPPVEFPYSDEKEEADADYGDSYIGAKEVCRLLEEEKVVINCGTHGIPHIWKQGGEYRVVLYQYRDMTECEEFCDREAAIAFFEDLCHQTA